MNTTNIALQTAATALVAWGVETVRTNLWGGVVIVVLGIAVYAVYELLPTKP